jgi:chromosome condensin MukBEF MukE localization factor
MAVYEGARPRSILLPRRPPIADAPVLDRRRVRGAVRSGQRTNRLGLILGSIVVAFMLAFFSLAQQVRVSATGLDIGRLALDRQRLDAQAENVRSDLNRLGREPAIRKMAIDNGLGQLTEPIVLPAR